MAKMVREIIIAEKPSVKNLIKKVFKDKEVLAIAGHITQLAFEKNKKLKWDPLCFEKLFRDRLVFTYKKDYSTKQIKQVKPTGPIRIIFAVDPDEQGQKMEKDLMSYFKRYTSDFKKVYLESLNEKGIKRAFSKISDLSSKTGLAGQLRSLLDLWFGAILSRASSIKKYLKTKKWETYNSGRVQTPTLNFVYLKEKELAEFKQSEYFCLSAKEDPSVFAPAVTLPIKYKLEKDLPTEVLFKLESITNQKVYPRPGLNTDQLLTLLAKEHACFKNLGSFVTGLLSKMYLNGLISYPRTENNSYNNFEQELKEYCNLYEKKYNKKAKLPILSPDKEKKDHAPITPIVLKSEELLQNKVLDTLFNHSKKIFGGPNLYKAYVYTYCLKEKEHKITFLKKIEKNFEDGLISYKALPDKDYYPDLKIQKKKTKPPLRYTFSTLLKQMSTKGIGTKSTRTTIIDSLIKNRFIELKDSKIKLLKKGFQLVQFWTTFWPLILSPNLTKEVEEKLEQLNNIQDLKKVEKSYIEVLKEIVLHVFGK